jgi:hypothetical protein
MAQSYTPGLTVSRGGTWRRRRVLPIAGDVLVEVGQFVEAREVVARTLLPGDAVPVHLAKKLGVSGVDLQRCLLKHAGDRVTVGESLARTKGLFGFFQTEFPSPVEGTLEAVSHVTGQVIFRGEPIAVQVRAYLTGRVVEILPQEGVIVESDAALVQGIFGVGGEAFGKLRLVAKSPSDDLTDDVITPQMQGCVVIGGRRITEAAVRKAVQVGVSAVIAGGIDDHDLREILGYDLGVAVTGNEKIGTTIIITEGFGEIAMARRTFDLLQSHDGREASVNGTTQIRAGVMRPEIVIPLGVESDRASRLNDEASPERPGSSLEIGASVRIIREPYFGSLGAVTAMPHEPTLLESESFARVVEVRLASGLQVIVPRANVELIDG